MHVSGREQEDLTFHERLVDGFDRVGLEIALAPETYTPHGLVEFFAQRYGTEYDADIGVAQGYTLGEHTELVLGQYDRYFGDDSFMRVVVALHDIGKPEAVRRGSKWKQYEHTPGMADEILREMEYDENERRLAVALVSDDFIGGTIKGVTGGNPEALEQNAAALADAAAWAGVSAQEFFDRARILYMSDASSYTADAGGSFRYPSNTEKPSLAFLFQSDSEGRELRLAPDIEPIVGQLKERTLQLADSQCKASDPDDTHITDQATARRLVEEEIQREWGDIESELPADEYSDAPRPERLEAAAHRIGIVLLEDDKVSPERVETARSLAEKLVRWPSRVTDISGLSSDGGLLSTVQKGLGIPWPKEAQNISDRVIFTFGPPYIFNEYVSEVDAGDSCPAVVVLDGKEMLSREDLFVSIVDTGLFYLHFHPLQALTKALRAKHPDLSPSPLNLFYEYVCSDASRKDMYRRYMTRVHERHSLPASEVKGYLAQLLARSFPLFGKDTAQARSWKTIYSPEGSVEDNIPIEAIEAVIVSDDCYGIATEQTAGTGIKVVNAGSPVEAVSPAGTKFRNLHLLNSYAQVIQAEDGLQPFMNFFMAGEGLPQRDEAYSLPRRYV